MERHASYRSADALHAADRVISLRDPMRAMLESSCHAPSLVALILPAALAACAATGGRSVAARARQRAAAADGGSRGHAADRRRLVMAARR